MQSRFNSGKISRSINKLNLFKQYLGHYFKKKSLKSCVGIEVDSTVIRFVELVKDGGNYFVQQCGIIDVDEMAQRKSTVALNYSQVCIATALPLSVTMSKEIKLNCNLNDYALYEFLQLNLRRYFNFNDIDKFSFDFQVLQRQEHGLRVYVTLAKQQEIAELVGKLSKLCLQPKVIDIEVYALARAVKFLVGDKITNIGVINFGQNVIQLIVLQDENLVYVESVEIKAIIELPHWEIDKASVVAKIIFWLQEEFTQLEYLPLTLLLSGKIIYPELLEEQLMTVLGIRETVVANPFSKLRITPGIEPEQVAPYASQLMISLGLALRGMKYAG